MLDIQSLGAIGELVSGIGVLATLIYLALQIREGNQHSRFSAMVTSRQLAAEHLRLKSDPEISRIWLAGLGDPEELQQHELSAFYALMTLTVNASDIRIYRRSLAGLPATEYDDLPEEVIAPLARHPGFKRWWQRRESTYGSETRRIINGLVSEASQLNNKAPEG